MGLSARVAFDKTKSSSRTNNNSNGHSTGTNFLSRQKIPVASTTTMRRKRNGGFLYKYYPYAFLLKQSPTLLVFRIGFLFISVVLIFQCVTFVQRQQQDYASAYDNDATTTTDWQALIKQHQQRDEAQQGGVDAVKFRLPRRRNDPSAKYDRLKRVLKRQQAHEERRVNNTRHGRPRRRNGAQAVYSVNNPKNVPLAPPNKTLGVSDFADLKYDEQHRARRQQPPQHPKNEHDRNVQLQQEEEEEEEAIIQSRKPLLDLLKRAGFTAIDDELLHRLPRWQDVTDLYGSEPVIYGMDTCQDFRDAVPEEDRFVAPGGQQNVGTNALGQLMAANLKIPKNLHQNNGMQPQLPWNKHGWLDMRGKSQVFPPFRHEIVMPVFVIRDPFFWVHSMCESPYNMNWRRNITTITTTTTSTNSTSNQETTTTRPLHCPNLVSADRMAAAAATEATTTNVLLDERVGEPVQISWSKKDGRKYKSLAHVWSEWYREYYLDADFPRLMVRFEDLIFHAPAVIEKVRECIGAVWKEEDFVFVTQPAKTHKYFTDIKAQSGMISAMIRYGQDPQGSRRTRNMTNLDLAYARKYFDPVLMENFHYQWPNATTAAALTAKAAASPS